MTTTPTVSPELPYTDGDILELVGLAQRMREIKHWEMQAGSTILAEIVGRMHAALSGCAQPYATGGMVPGGLYLAGEGSQPLHTLPEGEARQVATHRAVIEEAAQVLDSAAAHNRSKGRTVLERTQQDRADRLRAVLAKPAASLSPLCGAQPAESGKESVRQHEAIEAAVDRCYPKQDSAPPSVNDKIGAARLAFRKGYRAALHFQQAAAPRTDLSKRIRAAATADVTLAQAKLLIGAAEEIERAQKTAAPGALYSYMGESGRYELLGHAVGAGKCRLIDPLTVYRDTATGNLYFRHPSDFAARMVVIEGNASSGQGTPEAPQTAAARDVLAERQRQVKAEGYDHENDDNYVNDEMAAAAAFYVMPPGVREWPMDGTGYGATMGEAIYPDWMPPKLGDRRRDLVKGAALALAEIERLDRASAPKGGA